MDKLQQLVLEWAEQKGLLTNIDDERIDKQTHKVIEEIGETCKAYLKGDRDELIDGIGDIAVTIIILNKMKGRSYLKSKDITIKGDFKYSLIDVNNFFSKNNFELSLYALHNFALSQNTTLEHCLQTAYDVISKRTGKMVNGTFIKD